LTTAHLIKKLPGFMETEGHSPHYILEGQATSIIQNNHYYLSYITAVHEYHLL